MGTVIYFTAIDTKTDLGELDRTLRFSDSWGTHRGFMWNKALEEFGKLSFVKKLFGTGPETFYYTFSPHFAELYDRFGDGSTDAAHNEYINYLLNIGIVGLAAYLTFAGSALVRVVNIALPIATPLFFIFVALCEAGARTVCNKKEAAA